MKEFDTLAELQGSTQSKTGLRLKCRENLYEYIVQASGYTATGDDVTFSNGRVAKCVFAADAKYIKTVAGNVQDDIDSIIAGALPSQSGNEFKFLTTNGTSASWFQGTLQMDTFANLQTFSPTVDGTTFICQERANARYILQTSGYVALPGDVTFANGRVGALQIDGRGMNVLCFGSSFDSAIVSAATRCQGLCNVIIGDNYDTDGVTFSSLSNVHIEILEGCTVTLSNNADTYMQYWDSCTGVSITGGGKLDGNRANQTVSDGASAFDMLRFEGCNDVTVDGLRVTGGAGANIRGRNTSSIVIEGVNSSDSGFIPIYVGPGVGGSDVDDVKIVKNTIDWSSSASSTVTNRAMISVTVGGSSNALTNVIISQNFVKQHPDNVTDSICIGLGGVYNVTMSNNILLHGDLGYSFANCTNVSITGGVVDTAGRYGVEVAHGNSGVTVSGTTINGRSSMISAIPINGVAAAVTDVTVDGINVRGAIAAITSSAASAAAPNLNIEISNLNAKCTGRVINMKWSTGVQVSGGTLDASNAGTSTIQFNECDDFSVQGVKFRNTQTYAVQMFSSVAFTVNTGSVIGCDFDVLAQDENYLRNSLTSGTLGHIVVRGNNRGCDYINYASNVKEKTSSGTPEGVVTAGVGSRFFRTDGGASTTFYVKESGTGNTGWVAK